MSPDRQARAAALRAHLEQHAPEISSFLDEMKADFGATVLYVSAAGVEQGREPEPGVQPYFPLPASTWKYGVGESPGAAYKTAAQQQKKGRRVKR
jgi:hypothetical protein